MAQRVRQTMSRCWLAHSRACSSGSTSASSRSMWHVMARRVASTALHRSASSPATSWAPRLLTHHTQRFRPASRGLQSCLKCTSVAGLQWLGAVLSGCWHRAR